MLLVLLFLLLLQDFFVVSPWYCLRQSPISFRSFDFFWFDFISYLIFALFYIKKKIFLQRFWYFFGHVLASTFLFMLNSPQLIVSPLLCALPGLTLLEWNVRLKEFTYFEISSFQLFFFLLFYGSTFSFGCPPPFISKDFCNWGLLFYKIYIEISFVTVRFAHPYFLYDLKKN